MSLPPVPPDVRPLRPLRLRGPHAPLGAAGPMSAVALLVCLALGPAQDAGAQTRPAGQAGTSAPAGTQPPAMGSLRGTDSPVLAAATTDAPPRPSYGPMTGPARTDTAASQYLARGVWRTGPCERAGNFQTFVFAPRGEVEVGSGTPGAGERLELVSATRQGADIQVETRVCAPVGCNQTFEVYRVLDDGRMQEWRFEGRLPGQAPYVLVADGRATDGTPGRVFQRCQR